MSLFNKVAFYPTLFYNVFLSKVSSRRWYDRIDDTVLLGALPFRGMTKWLVNPLAHVYEIGRHSSLPDVYAFGRPYPLLDVNAWPAYFNRVISIFQFCIFLFVNNIPDVYKIKVEENVKGVVTLNEDWELEDFCNTEKEWAAVGVTQLKVPTVDFTASPSHEKICRAVDFMIKYRNEQLGSVYVHCKAGRTRSATVVACYLVKVHGWNPEEAIAHIEEKRPHIWLREKQLASIQHYYNTSIRTDKQKGA
ncbi:phosphatidylglycerophosphatase and protein-tyrosine phosphatase 1-like [Mya arenaria]|uniref:phosphatidylglycerophosphatase and protein-tyrosine phosphatase 1-like n=1 Tax=Mya arenaria TaxID=6604 RepID=UPI0022E7CFC2|nr:phosphatidylglycerophosphatase and protein-tyrosine phosphatase 1-like [Mya arenaria]